jgi:hypothetical protein
VLLSANVGHWTLGCCSSNDATDDQSKLTWTFGQVDRQQLQAVTSTLAVNTESLPT